MFWELVFSFAVRSFLGFCASSALGAVGFVASGMLYYPGIGLSFFFVLSVCAVGIGAGIGSFVGWLRRAHGWVIIFVTLGLALIGGMAGAWGGVGYARMACESARYCSAARVATILGAVLVANVFPLLASIYWARHRQAFH